MSTLAPLMALALGGLGCEESKIAQLSASLSVVTTSPQVNVANGTSKSQIIVVVLDSNYGPVQGASVTVAASGSGNTVTQPTAATGADGVARGFISSTVAESKTITATARRGTDEIVLDSRPTVSFISTGGRKLAYATQPRGASAGSPFPLTVEIQDENGATALAAGDVITLTLLDPTADSAPANGAIMSGTTTRAAFGGFARFTGLTIDKPGTYRIRASATGLESVISATFPIVPAPAATVEMSDPPATISAGDSISLTLTFKDRFGNLSSEYSGTMHFTSTDPRAQLPADYTFQISDAGTRAFTVVLKAAGTQTITVTDTLNPSLTASKSVTVNAGAASRLVFTNQPGNIAAGTPFSPTVEVRVQDEHGNTISGTSDPVKLTIDNGGALEGNDTVAPTQGIASFAGLSARKVGSYKLTATAGSLTSAISNQFVVTPGPVSQFQVSPATTTPRAGDTFSISVTAQDRFGNTVPTYLGSVRFDSSDTNPQRTLPPEYTFVVTDGGSHQFGGIRLITTGTQSLSVTDRSTATVTGSTNLTVGFAPAAKLGFTVQPSGAVAGIAIAPAVKVAVQDQFGNKVTGADEAVTVSISGSGVVFEGDRTQMTVDGEATFTNLVVKTAGTYTLTATGVTSARTVTSGPFVISAAAASTFTMAPFPSSVVAGTDIVAILTVKDAFGNNATGYRGTVTFAAPTDTQADLPTNYTFTTLDAGQHSFQNLKLKTVGSQTVTVVDTVTASLLASSTTNVTPALPSKLAFASTLVDVTAGAPFSVTVRVTDAFGNLTNSQALVSLQLASGTGPLLPAAGSSLGPIAATSGIATFSGLTIQTAGGPYSIRALSTDTSLSEATTNTFNVIPAAASQLIFSMQPPMSISADGMFTVKVRHSDAFGNTVPSEAAPITLSLRLGMPPPPTTDIPNGIATGTTTQTTLTANPVSGEVTFADISVRKSDFGYTLRAAATVGSGAIEKLSSSFDVTAGAAKAVVFSTSPQATGLLAGASFAADLAIEDAYKNPVLMAADTTITLALDNPGNGAVLEGPDGPGMPVTVTAVGGIATASNLKVKKAGTGYKLSATATNLTPALSSAFEILPAAVAKIVFTAQPAAMLTADDLFTVKVAHQDQFDNIVTTENSLITLTLVNNDDGMSAGNLWDNSLMMNAAQLTSMPVNGEATFANVAVRMPTIAPVALKANTAAATIADVKSTPFEVSPGAPTQIVFEINPPATGTVAGAEFSADLTIKDAHGNPADNAPQTTITLALDNPPAGAVLEGPAGPGMPVTTTALGGLAAATGLKVKKAGTGYKIKATATGLTDGLSTAFDIGPADAAKLLFSQQPMNVTSVETNTVKVAIADAFDNLRGTGTDQITLNLNPNPAAPGVTLTQQQSATAGVATFSGLAITKAADGYQFEASATFATATPPNVTASSTLFNVAPGAATKILFVQGPPMTRKADEAPYALTVAYADANNNVVKGISMPITLTLELTPATGLTFESGAAPTTSVMATPDAQTGIATFAGIAVRKVAMGYTFRAAGNSLSNLSNSFDVDPGTPSKVVFTQQPAAEPPPDPPPTNIVAGGNFGVIADIQDGFGNLVDTLTAEPMITLAVTTPATGVTLLGTTSMMTTGGQAIFSGLKIETAGNNYVITASSPPLMAGNTDPFNVLPGAATSLAFTMQPPPMPTADDKFTVKVAYKDTLGNNVPDMTPIKLTLVIDTDSSPAGNLENGQGASVASIEIVPTGGEATFTDIAVRKADIGLALKAETTLFMTTGKSNPFDVDPGAAKKLAFSGSPIPPAPPATDPIPAGVAFDIIADIQDNWGNLTASSGVTVSFTLCDPAVTDCGTPANGAFLENAPLPATPPASPPAITRDSEAGQVLIGPSFPPRLAVRKASAEGAVYRIKAQANGMVAGLSEVFKIDPGPIAKLALLIMPTTLTAGVAATAIVTAEDPFQNAVRNYDGTVSFTSGDTATGVVLPSSFQFVPATDKGTKTFTGGVTLITAIFGQTVSISGTCGSLTTGVCPGGAPLTDQVMVDVNPGVANRLRLEAFLNNPLVVNVWAPIPDALGIQVNVEDQFGNALLNDMGRAVTLDFGTKPNALASLSPSTPVQATTDLGVASFTGVSISQEGDGYTLVATSDGLTMDTTTPINVVDNNAPGAFTVSVTANVTASSSQGGKSTVTLQWVEPGDDDVMGQPRGKVASYDVRYSKSPITNQTEFGQATAATPPTPVDAGQTISVQIANLDPNTTYHFAVQAYDDAAPPHRSPIAGTTAMTPNCGADDVLNPSNQTCVDNACTPTNPCTVVPSNSCEGNTKLDYSASAPGACTPAPGQGTPYTCAFTPVTTDCAAANKVCINGECVDNACAGNPCMASAPKCESDNVTLTTFTPVCTPTGPTTFTCSETSSTTNCSANQPAQVCFGSACADASAPAAGDLILTEVMHSPTGETDGTKEWFEVKNVSNKLINLNGVKLKEISGTAQSDQVASIQLVGAGAYFVFGGSTDTGANGGASVSYMYNKANLRLPVNGHIQITLADDTLVEEVNYNGFPQNPGKAMNLSSQVIKGDANTRSWWWCDATASMSGGDFGSPGAANDACGVVPQGEIDFCNIQSPNPGDLGTIKNTDTVQVFSQFWEQPYTERTTAGNDYYPFVKGFFGYGPNTNPLDATTPWTWVPIDFNPGYSPGTSNNDEMWFSGSITTFGSLRYGFRYQLLDPADGTTVLSTVYCDKNNKVTASPPASVNYGSVTVVGCGDGATQAGEECDDGNTNSFDGCSATCKIEGPHLLISEFAVTPTEGEFIEIFNPTASPVDLSNIYLADYNSYYLITTTPAGGAPNSTDFRVKFPAGATIPARGFVVVSTQAAADFNSVYGKNPDFSIVLGGTGATAMVGDIGSSRSLTNSSEMIVLFQWNGSSDLVTDLDYVFYGGTTSNAMDKSGVTVGSGTYQGETAVTSQSKAPVPGSGSTAHRCDASEGTEAPTGGNGSGGHEETSEDLATTFKTSGTPTPGSGPPAGLCQ